LARDSSAPQASFNIYAAGVRHTKLPLEDVVIILGQKVIRNKFSCEQNSARLFLNIQDVETKKKADSAPREGCPLGSRLVEEPTLFAHTLSSGFL